MIWISPFAVMGIHRGLPADEVTAHAEQYHRSILALRVGRFDIELAQKSPYLNSDLARVIRES